MKRAKPLILNIDDDLAGSYAVGRALKQAGFEVVAAVTGATGLLEAEQQRPDLILLDIRLPDIDGFEVCRIIRSNPDISGTPVLQMSASYLDVSSRVKGLDNGADAYLTEPVEPAILVATINSLLRLKKAENSVRQTAREWQSTFDAIGEGVALLDAEGQVARANASFEMFQGLSEVISRSFNAMCVEGRRHEEEAVLGDRTVLVTLDPVSGEAKGTSGAVCVVCDITEKKRFEAQLRQTARLESIGVLAGGIAHDFNNLLTGILGNSSLLLETLPEGSGDRELALEIVKASESAADLTRQILAYSGKARFVMKPLDISAIASESRTFVRRFIPPRVELSWELAPDLPAIEGDAGQMQQLLMNLVINAAESFPEGKKGTVRVATGEAGFSAQCFAPEEDMAPGQYVFLSVADNGSGMDEATKNRIFDPFFTTKFAGRGLGLSAVHGIVKAHKGILRLESKLGEGTTFRLYFPASTALAAPALPEPVHVAAAQGAGTVLVIDDESVVRNFARAALEMRGFKVLLAEDGRAGVEAFRQNSAAITLVVLDLTMPVMDGEEAFREIRRISAGARVILSSGYSAATASEKFQEKGLAGFLGKPFTGAQLAEAVESALRGEPIAES